MEEYLGALRDAQREGLTTHIGLSNFTCAQMDKAKEILGDTAIFTNQVEVHPFLTNLKVVDAIQSAGLTATAYMPLAVGKVLEDETLKKLGDKYQASAAQVVLAWLHQKDIVVIPSSTKEAHLKANREALDIKLEPSDVDAIESLNRDERIANPDFAPDWD